MPTGAPTPRAASAPRPKSCASPRWREAGTALLIGFIIGPWLIGRFRELKFGHGYIDERTGALGATYFDKKHTPTMGGLIIFLSLFISAVLWAEPNVWVVVALFVYAALTVPGVESVNVPVYKVEIVVGSVPSNV